MAERPIGVVLGASSVKIQRLLTGFVERWRATARIAGVIEEPRAGLAERAPGTLRSIADARVFPIYQDLGCGAGACTLDSAALVEAGQSVCRDIARGCDLVVLNKFGKLEAEGNSGLLPALLAAIEAGVPVLTSVSQRYAACLEGFAAPYHLTLPAAPAALDDWWMRMRGLASGS